MNNLPPLVDPCS